MKASALLTCWVCSGVLSAQVVHVPLNKGWSFHQEGKERSYLATVPGVVHTDLLQAGLIPDPYVGSNVDSVQWIEEEDWVYGRTFFADDELLSNDHVDLIFKGLDTFAEIHLNDSLLGRADNMFRTWEFPVRALLRPGPNALKVVFRSPIAEGRRLREAYGVQLPHDNDPSGVSPYIRKAAYQFGWDFCPRLVTCGIWQPVELRCWNKARLHAFHVSSVPSGDSLVIVLSADMPFLQGGTVRFTLDGEVMGQVPIVKINGIGATGYSRTTALPDLWWPNGSGGRPLHAFAAELIDADGTVLDRVEKRTGYRTIELVQDTDSIGRAFIFRVNGGPVFMKGCNLVPPGMFLPEAGDAAWVELVRDMRRAHMNMVRVWAGGVYPPEAFFAACDTAGILVWQDFMVANLLPGGSDLRANIMHEAIEQAERMAVHPSLALLCGNNELDVAWANWGWQQRYALHGRDSIRVEEEHAMLERDLAMIARVEHVAYVPTSPLSNWGDAEGLRNGDLHYWGVWHGDSTLTSFRRNVGRFVSEYGFQSYPDSALLARYIRPGLLYLGSPALKALQRSYRTDRPIIEAIRRELGTEPSTLGAFITGSQDVQAKACRMAIEAHWAARPRCMGTLVWQLNDPWPGPSWSLIDHDGHWKPAMYTVQDLYGRMR